MLFKYTGINSSGEKVKSKIEAISLNDAKVKLKAKRIIYKTIKEDSTTFALQINIKSKSKIKTTILANISQDLSIYLNAGISIVNAIKLLNERYKKDKKLNTFFESINTFLDEGKNFYTALDLQKSLQLPEFYKQSIRISENGGLLESVLLELSIYLKNQDKLAKQTTTAMAYPLFMFVVSIFVVGFMLSFIVPKITVIFTRYDQELPWITSLVITLGDFFSNNYESMIFIFLIGIGSFTFCIKRFYNFKFAVDNFLLKLPFIGTLIEYSELSRFAYMNSILIRSGVPIVQSFSLSSNIINNSVLKEVFETASAKVVEGENLSNTLESNKIYKIDSSFIHSIRIGEETSQLNKILNNLAKLYTQSSNEKIALFLVLLEPAFMLFVGSVIGFIVIAMLLPIFSMNLG